MNALFGLRVRVTVGERLLVGVGTATGVYLSALQPPPVPRVTSGGAGLGREQERQRAEVQRLLHTTIARNKEAYGTRQPHSVKLFSLLVMNFLFHFIIVFHSYIYFIHFFCILAFQVS